MTAYYSSWPHKTRPRRTAQRIAGLVMVTVFSMVLAACGGGGGGGSSSSSNASAAKHVRLGYLVSSAIVTFTAEQEDYFSRYGLDVTSNGVYGGPNLLSAALGGSVDIFSGSPPLTSAAASEGKCIKYLAFEQGNVVDIIGSPKVPWPSAGKGKSSLHELEGKTVGVPVVGGGVNSWVSFALKKAGVDLSKVKFVAVKSGPATVAAISKGSVDAVAAVPPSEALLGEGAYKMLYKMVGTVNSPLKDLMVTGVAATCSWIKEHPKEALGVCKAMWDAKDFAFDPKNRNAMVTNVKKLSSMDSDTAAKAVWETDFKSGQHHSEGITKKFWEAQKQFMPKGVKLTPYDKAVYAPCNNGDPRK